MQAKLIDIFGLNLNGNNSLSIRNVFYTHTHTDIQILICIHMSDYEFILISDTWEWFMGSICANWRQIL